MLVNWNQAYVVCANYDVFRTEYPDRNVSEMDHIIFFHHTGYCLVWKNRAIPCNESIP